MRWKAFWLALALSVCAAISYAQQAYTITQVTPYGSSPTALSQDGWVVGEYTFCCNVYFSFYWKPDVPNGTTGTVTKLDNTYWQSLRATGVNGGYITIRGFQTGLAGSWGLVWHDGALYSYYGCNPPSWGPNYGVDLYGINTLHQVTGQTCLDAGIWSNHDTLPDAVIGNHPDGNGWSYSINDHGVITGSANWYMTGLPSCTAAQPTNCSDAYGLAFIAGGGTGFQYLPWVPGTAGCNGESINNANEVVGTCIGHPDNGGAPRAWIYSGGQMKQIGCVSGGCYDAYAHSINDQSQVVGEINDGQNVGAAYLWDATNGVRHLAALLPPNAPTMDHAVAINNAGQILTLGHDGSIYLLTPAPTADLSITNTAPPSVTYLDNVTYSITVTNGGPSTATGVTVSDAIPANASFVSATPSAGSCSGTATVTCSIGQLASGASATVTLVVSTTAAGTLTNTATASGNQTDLVSSNNSATAVTTVNPKQATLTWTTPATISYGTPLSGTQLDASADTAGTFTYSPASGAVLHAGTQTLSVSFAPSSANYAAANATVLLSLQAASLTIKANDQLKPYGAPLPVLTASYTGFVNGDTVANLASPASLTTTATQSSHASGNPYTITASGAASTDYVITYIPGSLTITAVPLTITANDQMKAYGAPLPVLTASYAGFVNGDTAASLTASATLTTTATASSHVIGNPYPITASGAASSDYTITYLPGSLTVTPVTLKVTANDQTKPYGAPLPSLTASYAGFANGDSVASLTSAATVTTTATASSHVSGNPYAITASGAASSDYTISYAPGALTIAPVALTITANDQTKFYGAPIPVLTASYAGFVNGDSASSLSTQPLLSTTATATSGVGAYAITASGAADADYIIAYAPGTLTISAAPTATALTASPLSILPGQTVSLTATVTTSVSGLVVSSGTISFTDGTVLIGSVSVVSGQASLTTPSLAPGSHSIVASFGGDPNYMASTSPAVSVIVKTTGSLADLMAKVAALNLNAGNRNSLLAKLNAAQASLNRGDRVAATNQLSAFINEVQALEQSGRLTAAAGDPLVAEAQLLIASL